MSSNSRTQSTLTGLSNLIKLLPTGTVFLFQFLNPLLTNHGHCNPSNMYLSGSLIALCGLSCCFSSFTDSYVDDQGTKHYGIVTRWGLWTGSNSSPKQDLYSYKLRSGDFVHAFLALAVFGVVALLDPNSVECFYPFLESKLRFLLMVLPAVIGAVSSSIFVFFPNNRHGIGYSNQSATPPPAAV